MAENFSNHIYSNLKELMNKQMIIAIKLPIVIILPHYINGEN